MKRIFTTAGIILLLLGVLSVRAVGLDDHYVVIFNLIQEADNLNETGQIRPALDKYAQAQQALERFRTTFPGWNEKVINYRLNYVATKIAPLAAKLPPDKTAPPTPGAVTNRPAPAVTSDIDSQFKALTDEIQRLEANNKLLTAKLKEALSVQPAGVDPQEMAKAAEAVKTLQKENELMKVSLDQEHLKSSQMAEGAASVVALNQTLAEIKTKLARQLETMGVLQSENEVLKKQAAEIGQKADANSAESARVLDQAAVKISSLVSNIELLRSEKSLLESRLNEALAQAARSRQLEDQLAAAKLSSRASETELAKLRSENGKFEKSLAELERKLAKAESTTGDASKGEAAKRRQLEQDLAAALAKTGEVGKNLDLAAAATREKDLLVRKLLQEKSDLEKDREALKIQAAKAGPAVVLTGTESQQLKQMQREMERQLTAARTAAGDNADHARKLQKDKAALEKQQTELEAKLSKAAKEAAVAAKEEQIKRQSLDQELTGLRKKLEVAAKERSAKVRPNTAGETRRTETILARLEVLEAKPVPYSADELALFSGSRPSFASVELSTASVPPGDGQAPPVSRAQRSFKQVPEGARPLVVAAQRAFQAGDFPTAEKRYLEVLQQDGNNVNTLANLASIQLEINRVDDAEKNIKKALSVDPDDDFSLYLLGRIRFGQEKYDDALDALSRSAKINPANADTQNYLGIALSEKGLRQPAETALRKAIQIQSGHAAAHNNLSVVYITQTPPAVALARWHYQKSLAAGHARNLVLEKLLDTAK
ncbi:MAG: tetratricopeptide repeat protein [Pedosphaera sp.]|nr:tetratricopeptide repeat protein [Pedosphaera sp.]